MKWEGTGGGRREEEEGGTKGVKGRGVRGGEGGRARPNVLSRWCARKKREVVSTRASSTEQAHTTSQLRTTLHQNHRHTARCGLRCCFRYGAVSIVPLSVRRDESETAPSTLPTPARPMPSGGHLGAPRQNAAATLYKRASPNSHVYTIIRNQKKGAPPTIIGSPREHYPRRPPGVYRLPQNWDKMLPVTPPSVQSPVVLLRLTSFPQHCDKY